MPQPHGGALRSGSLPGNTPGTGRPKDAVREALTELARGKGFDFLNELLEGKIKCRIVGECEKCGHVSTDAPTPDEITAILGDVRASADQRLKALEQAHRYGIGNKDEVSIADDPRLRAVARSVVQVVRSRFSPQVAAEIEVEVRALLSPAA